MVSMRVTRQTRVARWRDWMARGLMIIAAAGALVALAGAFTGVGSAPAGAIIVQLWQLYGFGVFAGLFLLLAFAPRRYAGVWELVLANKLALGITGFVLLGQSIPNAAMTFSIDGALAIMTFAAYLLAKGYTAWSRSGTREAVEG